jgi:hypothetical protein
VRIGSTRLYVTPQVTNRHHAACSAVASSPQAVARRVTDGTAVAPTCRVMAYESALEGFRLGVATSAQLLTELAAAADSESLRDAERQVRALPGDLA